MDDLREAKPVSVYVREWTYEQKRGRLTETQASNASLMAMRREGDEIETITYQGDSNEKISVTDWDELIQGVNPNVKVARLQIRRTQKLDASELLENRHTRTVAIPVNQECQSCLVAELALEC